MIDRDGWLSAGLDDDGLSQILPAGAGIDKYCLQVGLLVFKPGGQKVF